MAATTKIQWCDHTWNPWRGCTKISPGCTHCYAESWSIRNRAMFGEWGDKGTRVIAAEAYWHEPFLWDKKARTAERRDRVFCASLADIFEDRPELVEPRSRLWSTVRQTPNLDWLILTKRPKNIAGMVDSDWGDGYPNVWLGVSVEDQKRANERVPILLETPAHVRFVSYEPALDLVDFSQIPCAYFLDRGGARYYDALKGYSYIGDGQFGLAGPNIDWLIMGGESGPEARPFDVAWARLIRDECRAAGVAFFLKQLGSQPFDSDAIDIISDNHVIRLSDKKGGDMLEWPHDLRIRQFPQPVKASAYNAKTR